MFPQNVAHPPAPDVTVIIGTYNRASMIPRAIASVLAQTLPSFELIVIDNGSTDGTRAAVEAYRDPRISYALNEAPTGSCAVPRNLGVARARAPAIAFLDDDDVWYPDKLRLCLRALAAHPESALVCHAEHVMRAGRILRTNIYGPWSDAMHERLLYKGNCLSPGASLIRTEALQHMGGFVTRPDYYGCEDYDLWIRMAERQVRFHFIPDVLGAFQMTGINESWDPYHAVRLAEMMRGHLLRWEHNQLSRRARAQLASFCFYAARRLLRGKRWQESLHYLGEVFRCGYPGLQRITRDAIEALS